MSWRNFAPGKRKGVLLLVDVGFGCAGEVSIVLSMVFEKEDVTIRAFVRRIKSTLLDLPQVFARSYVLQFLTVAT